MKWAWAVVLTFGLSLAAGDARADRRSQRKADPHQLFLAAVDSSLR